MELYLLYFLLLLEDYKKALDLYDKAIKINPKDAAVWGNKGSALDKLGKSEDAEKYYDKARTAVQ